MLHGLGGSGRNWTDLAFALADRAWVLVPDLPGFGQSPPPVDGDYRPATQARRIIDLIEWALTPQAGAGTVSVDHPRPPSATPRVHLFGNSLGGQIALRVAAERADLVSSLTLLAPAMPETWPQAATLPLAFTALPGFGEVATAQYLRMPAALRARRSLEVSLADPAAARPGVIDDAHQEAMEADRPSAVAAMALSARTLVHTLLARGSADPWRLAERVAAPTLLIYGRRDPLVNAATVRRATQSFAEVRSAVMVDAAHVAQLEHPERVARLWHGFLRETGVLTARMGGLPASAAA